MTKSLAKFGVIFLEPKIRNAAHYNKQINELIMWGKRFAEAGLLEAGGERKAGNLSFRTGCGMVITASGANLAKLTPKDFVEVLDWGTGKERNVVFARGGKEPSSESIIHHEIYRRRGDAKAIMHGHCGKILDNTKKMGLPITKKRQPYGTEKLVWEVTGALGKNNFMVVKGHGFVSLGKTINLAGKNALKVLGRAQGATRRGARHG